MFAHGYACGAGWAGGVEIEILYIYLFICEVEMGRIRESDMSSPQKIKNKNKNQKEERGKRKEGGMQANFENFEWQSESVSFWFGSLYTSYEREIETCC